MYTAAAVLYPKALATSITLPMEILQAASQMAGVAKRGAPQIRFLLTGTDRTSIRLGSGISLKPEVAFNRLPALDLLLLPSRWEGMPNVVLEAMASATAVVAFDVEGVAQLLGDQGAEQLVRRADFHGEAARVEQFAQRVLQLASQQELLARIGIANQ